MKLSHVLLAGLVALPSAYSFAQTTQGQTVADGSPLPSTTELSIEDQAAVDALKAVLADPNATTVDKANALSDAVAANPSLATVFQAAAQGYGLTHNQINNAVITGVIAADKSALADATGKGVTPPPPAPPIPVAPVTPTGSGGGGTGSGSGG